MIAVVAIASCHGFIQNTKSANFLLEHKGLSVRGGQASMSLSTEVPELRAPKSMYSNAADIGATKAMQSPLKIFILGILSGCHIAFGKHRKYFKMSHLHVFLSQPLINEIILSSTFFRRLLSSNCRRCMPRIGGDKSWTSEDCIRCIWSSFR